jgi:hypothetical protein
MIKNARRKMSDCYEFILDYLVSQVNAILNDIEHVNEWIKRIKSSQSDTISHAKKLIDMGLIKDEKKIAEISDIIDRIESISIPNLD